MLSLTNSDSRSKGFDVVMFPVSGSTLIQPAGSCPIMYLKWFVSHFQSVYWCSNAVCFCLVEVTCSCIVVKTYLNVFLLATSGSLAVSVARYWPSLTFSVTTVSMEVLSKTGGSLTSSTATITWPLDATAPATKLIADPVAAEPDMVTTFQRSVELRFSTLHE